MPFEKAEQGYCEVKECKNLATTTLTLTLQDGTKAETHCFCDKHTGTANYYKSRQYKTRAAYENAKMWCAIHAMSDRD